MTVWVADAAALAAVWVAGCTGDAALASEVEAAGATALATELVAGVTVLATVLVAGAVTVLATVLVAGAATCGADAGADDSGGALCVELGEVDGLLPAAAGLAGALVEVA